MKEDKFQQLSLFDDEEEQEEQEDFNKPSLRSIEELQQIRKFIYSKFYSFSNANNLIDFLLKIEFEDNFNECLTLSYSLELAFENIEAGQSITSFADIYNLKLEGMETEKETHERLVKEYRNKFDELFSKYGIKEDEKRTFLENIELYGKAIANIKVFEKRLSILKGTRAEEFESTCKEAIQQMKKQKATAEDYLKEFCKEKQFDFVVIQEFNSLSRKMEEETESTYFKESFLEGDIIEELQFIYQGIKEENPVAIRWNEYFEEGLSILNEYFANPEETSEEIKRNDEELISALKGFRETAEKEGFSEETQMQIATMIQQAEENTSLKGITGTRTLKPYNFKLLSGEIGKKISSQKEVIEDINKRKNPAIVDFSLIAIDDKKEIELPAKFKPVINGLLTFFETYGTTEAFSLIQFYEGYYKTQLHPEEKNSAANLKEIDEMIRKLQFLASRIIIKRRTEEGEFIEEEIKIIDGMFFPIIRDETKRRKYNRKNGILVEASNNTFYQFTSRPILYRYTDYFSNFNLITYNAEMWLTLPEGKRPKFTSQRNILIRDELLKRVYLIKQSKKMKATIIYKNFFSDFCDIDYEKATKKQKEDLRNVVKYFLDLFVYNKQIISYSELEEKRQKTGIKFIY